MSGDAGRTLYAQLLGESLDRLPPPLRDIHNHRLRKRYAGLCRVNCGDGWIAAVIGWVAGLPRARAQMPVKILIERANVCETWTRWFGTHRMRSTLSAHQGLLEERLGPMTMAFALVVEGERIDWVVKRVRALFLPLPVAWFAGCTATEVIKDGRYHFDARAEVAGIGLIVHYQGWLVEDGE